MTRRWTSSSARGDDQRGYGPFACLLGVDDFLGPDAAAALAPYADATPPLPTYFVGPAAHPTASLPPGIEWLGAAGVRSLRPGGTRRRAPAAPRRRRCARRRRRPASSASTSPHRRWPRGFFRQLAGGALDAARLATHGADALSPARQARCRPTCCPRPTCRWARRPSPAQRRDAPALPLRGHRGQWYQRPPPRQERGVPTSAGCSRWQGAGGQEAKVRARALIVPQRPPLRRLALLPNNHALSLRPWRPWTPCS